MQARWATIYSFDVAFNTYVISMDSKLKDLYDEVIQFSKNDQKLNTTAENVFVTCGAMHVATFYYHGSRVMCKYARIMPVKGGYHNDFGALRKCILRSKEVVHHLQMSRIPMIRNLGQTDNFQVYRKLAKDKLFYVAVGNIGVKQDQYQYHLCHTFNYSGEKNEVALLCAEASKSS